MSAVVKKFFIPTLTLLSVKHGYDEKFQTKFGLNPLKLRMSLFSVITKWSALSANKVICISKSLENFFDVGGLINPNKLITIPYGFNFSSISLDDRIQYFRYGNPQIIVTGRLEEVKQHHLLIESLPELLHDFPKLSIVMVGDGALAVSLKALGEKLGVEKSIHWLGFQTNVHNFIKASDIMVVPSSAEGFGLVVLESWFHAKPVIAFDVPAINEIIEHGSDGLLIEPFSKSALIKGITKLLKDDVMLSQYGKAGQKKQNTIYDVENMTSSTLSVLRDLYINPSLDNSAQPKL
jgi:glycosyltransferase involved in cell wall biosynthesis